MATFKASVKKGVNWIVEAVALVRVRPNKWMFFSLVYVILFAIMPSVIPSLSYLTTLIWPIFMAAAIAMFRNVDHHELQSIKEIIQSLQHKMRLLIILGAVSLVYVILMSYVLDSDIQGLLKMAPKDGGTMTESQVTAILDKMMPLLLKFSLLMLPLFMATWFSPMLIAFNNYNVVKAIKSSIAGSLQYMVALSAAWITLTAGIAIFLAIIGAVFGLINQLLPGLGLALAGPVIFVCMLIATGLMLAFQYVSYRDVFRAASSPYLEQDCV